MSNKPRYKTGKSLGFFPLPSPQFTAYLPRRITSWSVNFPLDVNAWIRKEENWVKRGEKGGEKGWKCDRVVRCAALGKLNLTITWGRCTWIGKPDNYIFTHYQSTGKQTTLLPPMSQLWRCIWAQRDRRLGHFFQSPLPFRSEQTFKTKLGCSIGKTEVIYYLLLYSAGIVHCSISRKKKIPITFQFLTTYFSISPKNDSTNYILALDNWTQHFLITFHSKTTTANQEYITIYSTLYSPNIPVYG